MKPLPRNFLFLFFNLFFLFLGVLFFNPTSSSVYAQDAESFLQQFSQAAKTTPSVEKGRNFFNSKHGRKYSCSSCHNDPPTTEGTDQDSDEQVKILAPAFNARAFTKEKKVTKNFRKYCNNVVGRECTDAEKADILAYLMSLKP